MPGHPQVGQREQRDDMGGVLLQPTEAHLGKPELALDHSERMFHFRAHAGLAVLVLLDSGLCSAIRHLGNVTRSRSDVPLQIVTLDPLLRATVA